MMYRTEVKRALGVLAIAAFFFGGLSMIAAEKVLASQPKATLQLQGQEQPAVMVNVNKATTEELIKVRGIGPVMAKRIIEHRDKNGMFKSIDDLTQVQGIGGNKLQRIRDQVTV
ncbi:MAG: ComEA family DNA-binding protein [Candidatus Omnitrophica bacterium]|nr:ComEA family DNA-binding protein [Candidatus Omnitrophota bacterium]